MAYRRGALQWHTDRYAKARMVAILGNIILVPSHLRQVTWIHLPIPYLKKGYGDLAHDRAPVAPFTYMDKFNSSMAKKSHAQ